MKQLALTDRDDNAEFHLNLGDKLTISLKAIPGTGYSWHICEEVKGILRQVGETDFKHSDIQVLGGSEHQVLHFHVQSSGKQRLKLEYRRPWEKTGAAIKSFSITVITKD